MGRRCVEGRDCHGKYTESKKLFRRPLGWRHNSRPWLGLLYRKEFGLGLSSGSILKGGKVGHPTVVDHLITRRHFLFFSYLVSLLLLNTFSSACVVRCLYYCIVEPEFASRAALFPPRLSLPYLFEFTKL
ncbi:hypothetical protein R1flu_006239 [Riccia fluitans]|uniref:Uncharacterized protein n=1 Tax=Riccia fluitans TaxID=41844 RepID=A0ABD1YVG6_9MARC